MGAKVERGRGRQTDGASVVRCGGKEKVPFIQERETLKNASSGGEYEHATIGALLTTKSPPPNMCDPFEIGLSPHTHIRRGTEGSTVYTGVQAEFSTDGLRMGFRQVPEDNVRWGS